MLWLQFCSLHLASSLTNKILQSQLQWQELFVWIQYSPQKNLNPARTLIWLSGEWTLLKGHHEYIDLIYWVACFIFSPPRRMENCKSGFSLCPAFLLCTRRRKSPGDAAEWINRQPHSGKALREVLCFIQSTHDSFALGKWGVQHLSLSSSHCTTL